jgi:hypothetical protein
MPDSSTRSISDEIDYLDSDIDILSAEIQGLTEQLGDVVSSEDDSKATPGNPPPADEASGSYTRIVWRRQRVQGLASPVAELRSRIEV